MQGCTLILPKDNEERALLCRNRQKAIATFLSALATARRVTTDSGLHEVSGSLNNPEAFTAAILQSVLAAAAQALAALSAASTLQPSLSNTQGE